MSALDDLPPTLRRWSSADDLCAAPLWHRVYRDARGMLIAPGSPAESRASRGGTALSMACVMTTTLGVLASPSGDAYLFLLALVGTVALAAALAGIATLAVPGPGRDAIVRPLLGALVRLVYRVRTDGLEHVPARGPALVVANHVSYTDALILGGLCRRPIRFVVYHRIHDAWPLSLFFRLVRAIPIAPAKEDPARLARALAEIDRALAAGEVVGIFPEGQLTRDGDLGAFRPGIERVLARRPVPVVPVALRGLWGSVFSYAGGPPLGKWPRRVWSRVELVAGPRIAASDASAERLRAAIVALLASARSSEAPLVR